MQSVVKCLPLLFLGALVGCEESTGSDAVRTKGIYAEMWAESLTENQTEVEVELRVGGDDGTLLELVGGDELIARSGGETKKLSPVRKTLYRANLGVNGGIITVDFDRPEGVSAQNNIIELPSDFSLSSPSAGATFPYSTAKNIDITWTNESVISGDFNYWVDMDCEGETFKKVFDSSSSVVSGTISISVDDIIAGGPYLPKYTQGCDATLFVEIETRGSINTDFGEGGIFYGTIRRSVNFTITE